MMIVAAVWPLMLKVQTRVQRHAVAVTVMSGAMVQVFVVPLVLAIQTLVDNIATIAGWIRAIATRRFSPPADRLEKIALAGAKIAEKWTDVAASSTEELASRLAPYACNVAHWLAGAFARTRSAS